MSLASSVPCQSGCAEKNAKGTITNLLCPCWHWGCAKYKPSKKSEATIKN